MKVCLSCVRAFLAAAVFFAALAGVVRSDHAQLVGGMTIVGQFKGRTVLVTATKRSAGAIESLQWGGTEFLNASDHGRHLQSAISFDWLMECDNPTEAGSSRDGDWPNSSTSMLNSANVAGNVLSTSSQMAYWLRVGDQSPFCGRVRNEGMASAVSSTRLAKTVRFLPGFDNVLEHRITFDMARPRAMAQFEVLTAYMREGFDSFYCYDVSTARMEPLSDGPGEQEFPVVLATRDGTHALGLLTLQTAESGLVGPGYGRWRFGWQRVTKSNVVFRLKNATVGPHQFVVYSIFGTLDDVRSTIAKLLEGGGTDADAAGGPTSETPSSSAGVLARN